MVDALITFSEGQDILASEANQNNQFLLSKLSDNASQLTTYVEEEITSVQSNIASVQATVQSNIDSVATSLKTFKANVYGNMVPNYTKGVAVSWATLKGGYTAPSVGVFMMYAYPASERKNQRLAVNNVTLPIKINGANADADFENISVVLGSGDVIKVVMDTTEPRAYEMKFFPYKGGV